MKFYYVLIPLLLTGCGGGGSTTSNPDSNVTRYSSDYAASDLQALFTLSATSSSDAEVTGYILDDSDLFVTLSGSDELMTSALATEYRVSFVRDGVDITQLTATEFPIPFDPVVSFSNEIIDVSF
ncbi:hypothetical protein, partial [Vibrio sp. M260112]